MTPFATSSFEKANVLAFLKPVRIAKIPSAVPFRRKNSPFE
jgi:hypothetical protein